MNIDYSLELCDPVPTRYSWSPMLRSAGFNAPDRKYYNPRYKGPPDRHGHGGLDLHARSRTPILGSADTTAGFCGRRVFNLNAGIQCDLVLPFTPGVGGWLLRHLHCDEVLVKEGDTVKAGQPIALVGNTGLSNYPHLHLEVRWLTVPYNSSRDSSGQGYAVDPMRFGILKRRCEEVEQPVWPRLLRPGDTHPVVPTLKALLMIAGVRVRANRRLGYNTWAVRQVEKFQKAHSLTVDGIVGPATRDALYRVVAGTNR